MDELRLFYENDGVDYDGVLRRLGNKEALLKKCLAKFMEDENFILLKDAVAKRDNDAMLMAAHTLKGLSANLDLRRLCGLTTGIVSCLREGKAEKAPGLFEETEVEYNRVIGELKKMF